MIMRTTKTSLKPSQLAFAEAVAMFYSGGDSDTIHNIVRQALSDRDYEDMYAGEGDYAETKES